jgi:hypothetical protein
MTRTYVRRRYYLNDNANFAEEERPRRRGSVLKTAAKVVGGTVIAGGTGYVAAKGGRKLAKKGAVRKSDDLVRKASRGYLKKYQDVKNFVKGRKKRNVLTKAEKNKRRKKRHATRIGPPQPYRKPQYGPPAPKEIFGPTRAELEGSSKTYGPSMEQLRRSDTMEGGAKRKAKREKQAAKAKK